MIEGFGRLSYDERLRRTGLTTLEDSDVNKDLGFKAKAKAKDLGSKAKAKDLSFKAKAKTKDLIQVKDLSQGQGLEEAMTKDQGQGKFPQQSFRKVT